MQLYWEAMADYIGFVRCRIEELTIQLETSHEVNKHLNGEVESLVLQVDELQKENEALTRHTQELTEKVTAEKRKAHSNSRSSLKEPASVRSQDLSSVRSGTGFEPTDISFRCLQRETCLQLLIFWSMVQALEAQVYAVLRDCF